MGQDEHGTNYAEMDMLGHLGCYDLLAAMGKIRKSLGIGGCSRLFTLKMGDIGLPSGSHDGTVFHDVP